MVFLFATCRGQEHLELEPNDTLAQATPIELGWTCRGYLATAEDHDFYRLRLERDTILRIELSGIKGVNHAMRLWSDAGEGEPILMKEIDDSRKSSPEVMANFLGRRGTCFIEVTHGSRDTRQGNTETPYELTVRGRESVNEEEEPNDRSEQATPLKSGKPLSAYYSPARNPLNARDDAQRREEDWYVFAPLRAGDRSMVVDLSITGVPGVNAMIILFDAELNEIASADNGGPGEPEVLKGVGLGPAGSRWYIMVTAKNFSANHEIPYTLSLVEIQPDAGYEIERNDRFEQANRIAGQSIAGRFNRADDRDYFILSADRKGSWYRIELRSPAGADTVVSVFNNAKEPVAEASGAGAGARVVIPALFLSGDAYVVVRARSLKDVPSADYFLTVAPVTPSASMEIEPNNLLGQATPFPGRRIEGFIPFSADRDFYLLSYDKRVRRSIRVHGIPGADLKVSLTDPLGYVVTTTLVKRNQTVTITELIDRKAYIVVESDEGDPDHPYMLEVIGE